MPLVSSSQSRQCFVCSGAPKPSCYRKGHVTLCARCKNIYSGGRDECPYCNPPTDKFRPTMMIRGSAASAPAPTPIKVTAKMVYADGPDRTMDMDEAEAEAAEPSVPVQEAVDEESSVEEEEEQDSLSDDESVHDDSEHDDSEHNDSEHEDSESPDDDSAIGTPVDTAPIEEVLDEEAPAQKKTFEEKLAGLTLVIPDREAETEQEFSGEEVEVFPDTPEDAIPQVEKTSMEVKKFREEGEKLVRKSVPASPLPVKKSVKKAAAHRCQTPDIPSCRRCSIHGKPATKTTEKKADAHRASLTKTKSVRGRRQIKEDVVEESNETLGECF